MIDQFFSFMVVGLGILLGIVALFEPLGQLLLKIWQYLQKIWHGPVGNRDQTPKK